MKRLDKLEQRIQQIEAEAAARQRAEAMNAIPPGITGQNPTVKEWLELYRQRILADHEAGIAPPGDVFNDPRLQEVIEARWGDPVAFRAKLDARLQEAAEVYYSFGVGPRDGHKLTAEQWAAVEAANGPIEE